MTNAVFMPYVLAFNRPAIEDKIERLAAYLGIDGGFDGFIVAVLDLRKKTGVPHDLDGLGVDDSRSTPSSRCRWRIRPPAAIRFL